MSKAFEFPFFTTTLTHASDVTLTIPGNMTEIAWLGVAPVHVARLRRKRANHAKWV